MPPTRFRIELGDGDRRVTILNRATSSDYPCLAVDWSSGLIGWYGTPDAKVSLTERQTSDGAHEVPDDQVLYAARTVTIGVVAFGDGRSQVLSQQALIGSLSGRTVRVRVVDATSDTYAYGYVTCKWDGERNHLLPYQQGTLTIVCPDPRRLATEPSDAWLLPAQAHGGGVGLSYGASGAGLRYQLDYGAGATDSRNSATVRNAGSAPAHPVVTLEGPLDAGATVTVSAGGSTATVTVGRAIAGGTSVTVDFRTRTASQGRLDVTRQVTATGWAPVPAGGEAACTLQATGTGSALVRVRDTYI